MSRRSPIRRSYDDFNEWLARRSRGSGSSLARAFGDATGFTISQGGGPSGIMASAAITPLSSGKLRVIVTGAIQNDSDSGEVAVSLAVSHGASATPADYTGSTTTIPDDGGGRLRTAISLVVDLDKIASPIIFPVGTPVQINAVATVLSAGQAIQGAAHSVQIEIEEKP